VYEAECISWCHGIEEQRLALSIHMCEGLLRRCAEFRRPDDGAWYDLRDREGELVGSLKVGKVGHALSFCGAICVVRRL
jgi:hypothetical protein